MLVLLYKSRILKFLMISFTLLFVSCTTNQDCTRKTSVERSCLGIKSLKNLTIPKGMALPIENDEYQIPTTNTKCSIDQEPDIIPPVDPLLLSGNTNNFSAKCSFK